MSEVNTSEDTTKKTSNIVKDGLPSLDEDKSILKQRKLPNSHNGHKVLFFGDTHFDDVFQGEHKDYKQNTLNVMKMMLDVYKKEKPDWVILAGDLIGVQQGRSKIATRQFLKVIIQFLTVLGGNKKHLIVVKGNHDYNVESDYNFLSGIGLFVEPKENEDVLYISPTETPKKDAEDQLFIHLRNYGREQIPIYDELDTKEYHDAKTAGINIVVAHNDFYVQGHEEGYKGKNAIDLVSHVPFYGADIVLSGHIHVPSTQSWNYETPTGSTSTFLNLGCPSRPSSQEKYNKVWYVTLEYADGEGWDYIPHPISLEDYRDEFINSEDLIAGVKKMIDHSDKDERERLAQLLALLEDDSLLSRDVIHQIDILPTKDKPKELAKHYIEQAKETL